MVELGSEASHPLEGTEVLALNDVGKAYLNRLESTEREVPQDSAQKGSSVIRETDYKMEAFERSGMLSPETKRQYLAFLEKYSKNSERPTGTRSERLEAGADILRDFSTLRLRDGRSVTDSKVDAGLAEGIESVYRGVSRGVEVAKEELRKQLESLVSPEEWAKIAEALANAAKNPIEFMDRLITAVKEGGGEVWKQVDAMWAASTKTGFSAEMGRYVPEVGIPFLIGSVGPGKFFKVLGLDRMLPDPIAKKLFGEVETVATAGKREVLAVEKLRGMKIQQIDHIFDGEVAATRGRNLRTIFAEFDKKDRTYPMKTEVGRNSEANEWARFTLGNVENILEVATERNNAILKNRIRTEMLEPISADVRELTARGLHFNPENRQKMAAMLERCENE